MKTIPFELHGKEYHLCMNGAALFDIYDKYGMNGSVTDVIEGSDRKTFNATCWMLFKLSEQGAMVRRFQGHERSPYLKEGELQALLTPTDVLRAKDAIRRAVSVGFSMETQREDEGVDLGLLELEEQSGGTLTRSQFLHAVTQLLHLGVKEGMLLTIGEVLDLLEVERKRQGYRREAEGGEME